MRVQCDVCENQLARVLCSADEAALCDDCDAAVHAANKLANKHQRVAILQGEPQLAQERPSCDICQVRPSLSSPSLSAHLTLHTSNPSLFLPSIPRLSLGMGSQACQSSFVRLKRATACEQSSVLDACVLHCLQPVQ